MNISHYKTMCLQCSTTYILCNSKVQHPVCSLCSKAVTPNLNKSCLQFKFLLSACIIIISCLSYCFLSTIIVIIMISHSDNREDNFYFRPTLYSRGDNLHATCMHVYLWILKLVHSIILRFTIQWWSRQMDRFFLYYLWKVNHNN